MNTLTETEINEHLKLLHGWNLEDQKWLLKKYRFKEYLTGVSFVQKVADLSELQNHHPFISIDYKVVTLKLSSWQANGLTQLDMDLAAQYDQIYRETIANGSIK